MKNFSLLLIFTLICTNTMAATLPSKSEAKKLSNRVMVEIGNGNMESGINLTRPYLIVPEHEFLALVDKMKMQEPAINQRFGKTIGIELATIEEVGESLMLVLYLQKFEKHVLRWKFYFYKPRDGWVLNTFTFDDQIRSMFQHQ